MVNIKITNNYYILAFSTYMSNYLHLIFCGIINVLSLGCEIILEVFLSVILIKIALCLIYILSF